MATALPQDGVTREELQRRADQANRRQGLVDPVLRGFQRAQRRVRAVVMRHVVDLREASLTQAAVQRFQSKFGFRPTGTVGDGTYGLLDAISGTVGRLPAREPATVAPPPVAEPTVRPAASALTDNPPVIPAISRGLDLGPACQQCGGMMQRTGSCYTCSSCGFNTGCG